MHLSRRRRAGGAPTIRGARPHHERPRPDCRSGPQTSWRERTPVAGSTLTAGPALAGSASVRRRCPEGPGRYRGTPIVVEIKQVHRRGGPTGGGRDLAIAWRLRLRMRRGLPGWQRCAGGSSRAAGVAAGSLPGRSAPGGYARPRLRWPVRSGGVSDFISVPEVVESTGRVS